MNDVIWLTGTWFVAASNHPLWVKGDKEAPTYTFAPAEKEDQTWISEEIKYVQDGEVKSITGDNFPEKNNFKSFTWKGLGPGGVNEVRWEVKQVDETGLWMLTWCEGTDKVPEHVHLLVKEPQLEDAIYDKVKKLMAADAVLQKHVGSLKRLL